MDGNEDTEVSVEKQLVFWFCAAVAPSLMEHALLGAWPFYWVGQHSAAGDGWLLKEPGHFSGNMIFPIIAFILPVYLPGKLISIITSIILPIYLLF